MRTMVLTKKDLKRHWVIGGIVFCMILGLMDQARADDPLSDLTNTATGTAPSPTTKPGTNTDAKLPTSPSTATTTQPAVKSNNQDIGGLSIDDLLNVTVTSAGQK